MALEQVETGKPGTFAVECIINHLKSEQSIKYDLEKKLCRIASPSSANDVSEAKSVIYADGREYTRHGTGTEFHDMQFRTVLSILDYNREIAKTSDSEEADAARKLIHCFFTQ